MKAAKIFFCNEAARGRIALVATALCMTAALPSYAADRTISSDYTLTADETVDGVLTIEAGATVDLAGHKLTVAGLAGAGTVTSSVAAVYRRLEYLESGGAPYINTGYTPVSATTAEVRARRGRAITQLGSASFSTSRTTTSISGSRSGETMIMSSPETALWPRALTTI